MVTEIVSWHLISISYFVKISLSYSSNTFIYNYYIFYCYKTICTLSEPIRRSKFFS